MLLHSHLSKQPFYLRNHKQTKRHCEQGRSQGCPGGPGPLIEMLFQIFKLNCSCDMPKMHYFSNTFSKLALIFNFCELKLQIKLIMTKSHLKKSIMTSF